MLPCVVSIANSIEQAAFLFEADVQNRVVEMGLFDRFFIAAALAGIMLLFFN